ncbi:tRNA-intron endonuclease catalytic domain-like protein [Ceraceosorus guamensis]|uniref:tRNA-splicing endonuclease subunit Sen34 n=1 Tax=Ceraceosorus guamensis TaxID=1522189 RepID=A0A316W0K6_9BASI|nr:tRNA-intron endonuclease catalytic domain-like protein [Ceraceosorus guamensis]PWN42071.1 tRNA-intron endonuclease catalytic domain-like protein [Ceraceosorus guamensis]
MPPPPPALANRAEPVASDSKGKRRESIPLSVIEGQAYLYSPQHIAIVRAEHHLTPTLGGTLPILSQQNIFLGPPATLQPEEVALLLRRGAAHIVDDPSAYDAPSTSAAAAYYQAAREMILEQVSRANKAREQISQHKLAEMKETEEVRAKRLARARARREQSYEADKSIATVVDVAAPETNVRTSIDLSSATWSQVTPATSFEQPVASLEGGWYRASEHSYTTLSQARSAGVWKFPSNARERARCMVFEDLNARGYFLSCGLRFGGDFNCYPGDPLRYHSHFTATVLSSRKETVTAHELIASGRLGTAVKKAHLICATAGAEAELADRADGFADAERSADHMPTTCTSTSVEYFSLTWAGFGT